MGCDIHMIAQVRKDGAWETALWPSRWDEGPQRVMDIDRNYTLFSILADVRNEGGERWFPEKYQSNRIEPMCAPRGLPEGIENVDYELGEHSFSWFMLNEVLDYDWDKTIIQRGCVDAYVYLAWKRSGKRVPDSYSKDVGGGRVQHISTADMEALIATPQTTLADLEHKYAPASWETRPEWVCKQFYNGIIPQLKALGKPEDVRLVFGFDS